MNTTEDKNIKSQEKKEKYTQKQEKEDVQKDEDIDKKDIETDKQTKEYIQKDKNTNKKEKTKEKHKKEKIKKDKEAKKEEKEKKADKTEESNKKYIYMIIIMIIAVSAIIFTSNISDSGNNSAEAKIEKDLTNATGYANIDFYYSYSCKPCYREFITLENIKAAYEDHVNINYMHFPLDLEADAIMDNAAECAKNEGEFISYSKKLFNAKKPVTEESAILIFESIGVNDTTAFKDCVDNKAKINDVAKQYKASLASKIDNLPSIIINGSIIAGEKPFSVYETIIDDEIGLR
jgi:thiol-disulfide isomerase/thioredoxin